MTATGYKKQVAIIEKRLEQLLKRTFTGLGRNLLDRYRKYRNSLFIFLSRTDVPAHNNMPYSPSFIKWTICHTLYEVPTGC